MVDSRSTRRHPRRREPPTRSLSWCCSFAVPPRSPQDNTNRHKPSRKPETAVLKCAGSFPNSPQSTRPGLVNRILSPGRVSPIDSESTVNSLQEIRVPKPSPIAKPISQSRSECSEKSPATESSSGLREGENAGFFDVRLNLKGKRGDSLVLELNSGILSANSAVFADLISDYRRNLSSSGGYLCRIEVPEVENLLVFRETMELMFEGGGEEGGITKRLIKTGVSRSIDILEVAASIKFPTGVSSCLKYLEAVPWSEEEEEKLRSLFDRFEFDEIISRDILSRLDSLDSENSQQNLARQLVWSITSANDANARNELKFLVKGLLQKSSIYKPNHSDIGKDDLYAVCHSCLESLVMLFEEASGSSCPDKLSRSDSHKPLVERISKQVDNINWVLEILLDRQIAEEFVSIWAEQNELLKMHESSSPMVRYELSRVSATLFIAIGTRNLQSRSGVRLCLLKAWFGPMLLDFGWLQRCRKGLEMKTLEESMGRTLLTLPLNHQSAFFMDWFHCFSKQGHDCPDLSKAFQVWWRRSFLQRSECHATESH